MTFTIRVSHFRHVIMEVWRKRWGAKKTVSCENLKGSQLGRLSRGTRTKTPAVTGSENVLMRFLFLFSFLSAVRKESTDGSKFLGATNPAVVQQFNPSDNRPD